MITFPSTKVTKNAIRNAIGQTVYFVIRGDPTPCPTCSGLNLYDGVNEVSLDPYCPVCFGTYWLTTDVSSGVVAHVRWRTQDMPDYTIAGSVVGGDCSITVDIDTLSESNIAKIKYVIADSRKLQVYKQVYRGVPSRDRIMFVCKEYGEE